LKRLLKILIGFLCVITLLLIGTAAGFWYLWSSNLPYIGSLEEYRPPIISQVFSDDGELIARFWEEKRIVVPLEDCPPHLVHAFVAAEDARFFEHEGVDFQSITRAFINNLMARKIQQGGSTITQQVTRSLLLKNTKRTYRRKAREAILSLQIEKRFSKERILFLYLNQIYLGQGAYGVEAAARTYFGKSVKDLNLAESAMLAGLPQAPSRYSPLNHFNRAKARQKYVLGRMVEEGYITKEQAKEAYESELELRTEHENVFARAPYFAEYVRQYLVDKYGKERLYRGGFKVYTTLNLRMQEAAREAILKGTRELDKREGYRGPLTHLEPDEIPLFLEKAALEARERAYEPGLVVRAVVTEVSDRLEEVRVGMGEAEGRLPLSRMKWARKPDPGKAYWAAHLKKPSEALSVGDVILVRLRKQGARSGEWEVALEQEPEVQAALLCMEPRTGRVKAMVGGRDFAISQFNRAIQARRQPGSAFKPIIYSAALDWGMSPARILLDSPYIAESGSGSDMWKPKNYKERFFGPTLFRTALAKSRNVITVKILREIGIPYAVQYARWLGIESDLTPDLSLALGSSGVSLMELTRAYAVFANGGMLVEPLFVERVVDRDGRVIEENQTKAEGVIPAETAYVMTDLLKAVVKEGTGWRIKALKRPAAGKTGTTNDLRDAWFMGYTPDLVTGVWVGYDDRKPMGRGETGSRAAAPIWLYFMREVLKDRPVKDFPVPGRVVFAKIDAKTGLLAGPYSEKTVFQAFEQGTEPTRYSPKPKTAKSGQFLQYDMDAGG